MSQTTDFHQAFVDSFRNSAPYINAHRGRTFVLAFSGDAVAADDFHDLVHDIALLNSLGIRLVLVHGARPQIEARLKQGKVKIEYANHLRITNDAALACVKEAAGTVRVEVEAQLSMGLANSPMSGADIRVTSGNFVIAKPLGVIDGVDYQHTGTVRRVDTAGIRTQLDNGSIVLLSPLGYSPTGEVFNISAVEIAQATAIALQADKVIYLSESDGLTGKRRAIPRTISPADGERLLQAKKKLPEELAELLRCCINACQTRVHRAHLVPRRDEGALLLELFTRDGTGTMVTARPYEGLRKAHIDDVGGVLELISPLEEQGVLVRRSRERLEMEIDHFTLIERDGMTIACAALYPMDNQNAAELACLAVHPDYRNNGRADVLLEMVEREAERLGITQLFVLTTQTTHWFRERGFKTCDLKKLPVARRKLYNFQRQSKVLLKTL